MTNRSRNAAFLPAPLLLAAYGVIRLVSHHRAPGLGWTLGHACFLAGMLLFVPVVLELRRIEVRGWVRGVVLALTAVTLVGLAGMAGQAAVDLWAGLTNGTHAGMIADWNRVDAVPVISLWLYQLGPTLFVMGLSTLSGFAAYGPRPRRLTLWAPPAITVGLLLPSMSLDLMPLGAALAAVALCARPRVRGEAAQATATPVGAGHAA